MEQVTYDNNPANPTQDAFKGKTKFMKDPKSVRGYQEVVTDYIEDTIPNTTIIPSALSRVTGNLSLGGQANGFDPHKPGKQLIYDSTNGMQKIGEWDGTQQQKPNNNKKETPTMAKKKFVDPAASPKKVASVPTEDFPAPNETVYLHCPGAKVPFKYHEIIIDPERHTVLLVLDTRSGPVSTPEFDSSSDENIVLSFDNYPNILFCNYYGQTFTIAQFLQVTFMVIEHEEPRT